MRLLFALVLFLIFWQARAQEQWAAGTIYFNDGRQQKTDMHLLVSFNEGSLRAKVKDQIATYSPRVVERFVYYDSLFEKFREFESVQTQFRKRAGSKHVFLELLYQGKEYSLYRRYIPVTKLRVGIIPLPDYYIGWAIWREGIIEPTLFLYVKNERAYQISKGIEIFADPRDEKRLNYKLDNSTLKILLEQKYKEMKKEVRANKLDISQQRGFIEGLKFLNGSSFQYNRKEIPRKWRN